VIGGAAGALPPMVGWAAATGQVTLQSFLLFLVIFVWTPPHFWALALFKSDDYGAAGVPMMPNAKGPARTRLEILIYTLILAPVGMTPALLGGEGPVYLGVSAVGGLAMVYFAYAVWRDQAAANGNRAAKKLFAFSILYLFTLFATVLTSHLLQRVL
jgi:protoheme IX farnesyltransferase